MSKLFEVNFNYCGLWLMVGGYEEEGYVESITSVFALEEDGKVYTKLKVDEKEFMKSFGDILYEEIGRQKLEDRLAHEDMMYDAWREEQYEKQQEAKNG